MNIFAKLFGPPITTISAKEAQKKLAAKPKPFLLDVRQPEEFRSGHIAGARLIPLGELRARMNELPKDREIIVVCHTGSRSRSASRQLVKAGYNVLNLQGGTIAWKLARLPLT